ncbi:MAG: TonB family protein [Bryobacteraceae bacterium]
MSEASCLAQRPDPSPAASPYYLWEAPGKPVSVRISHQVVDRLDRAAVETFRSISSRGSEIGGLLLGNVLPGTPAVVSIDDYELISCDYSRGPLFHLSDADEGNLQTALARCHKDGVQVVGFFRSQTRKGLALDTEDLALMESHFRDPQAVALLVRPFATKPSMGGIFIRENGQAPGEASCLEFPFQSALLPASLVVPQGPSSAPKAVAPDAPPPPAKPARGQVVPMTSRLRVALPAPPAPQPPIPEAPPPAPAATVEEARPAAPEAPVRAEPAEEPAQEEAASNSATPSAPRRKRVPWFWGAVAAALLACSGMLVLYPGVLHHRSGRPTIPLTLRVEHSAGDLLLTWNRDSDAIRNARKGVLTIIDGDRSENTPIDPQVGSIMYTPVTADVSFHLEVTGADNSKTTSESVRVLRTRPSPMPAETAKSVPAGKAGAAPSNPSPSPTAAAAAGAGDAPEAEPDPAPTKLATGSRPFQAASLAQRLRPALASDMPDAPGLGASPVQTAPASVNFGAVVPARTAMPAPAPAETRAPAPVRSSQLRPPELVSRKAPEYPAIAMRTRASGEVKVEAVIGVDGRIKSARAVSGPTLLQRAATDAVRQWVYKPAVLDGVPVESQTDIVLTFNPR